MSYRELKSYQQAAIYDFTVEFCNRSIDKKSRTHDQMVQASRSGKQNIVGGSSERTSQKSELKLLGVARASFQELLEDHEDFLRQRGMRQWGKDDREAVEIRQSSYKPNRSYWTYKSYLESPEAAANVALCLIYQANFLLNRQIKALENKFVEEGGYTEKMYRRRDDFRKRRLVGAWQRKYAD